MITLYIVGKHTPVVLKSARFRKSVVEGITVNGDDVVIHYNQINDMHMQPEEGDPMKKAEAQAQTLVK
jgi:hypothetical protein